MQKKVKTAELMILNIHTGICISCSATYWFVSRFLYHRAPFNNRFFSLYAKR